MINVKIITPEKVLLKESDNVVVNLPLTSGTYEVRESHAPFMANLTSGIITLEKEREVTDKLLAIHGGFIQIADDNIKIVAKIAELKDEIDFERANDSKNRANDRLNNPGKYKETIDVERAKTSLKRAKTRLALKD